MSFLKGIKQVDMIKCGLQYKRIALKSIFLLLIFNFQFSIFNCFAQERKTLPECIAQALESNYSIKIIRNEARMAKNDLNYSTFLPTVDANACRHKRVMIPKRKIARER